MKIEKWNGHNIRFVEQDGEWWAVLKDLCDALNLRTNDVSQRLNPDMMTRVEVKGNYKKDNTDSNGPIFSRSHHMLAVNEIGVYEALFSSRKLEARKFRLWTSNVIQKLRKTIGLQGYESLNMTKKAYQDQIDYILDSIYYDEEKGILMRSITVEGGDVEQVAF